MMVPTIMAILDRTISKRQDMSKIIRNLHYTDEQIYGSDRKRTLKNWSNYRTSSGTWSPSDLQVRVATRGDDFRGFSLSHVIDGAPLNMFIGDSASLGNRPWWGFRRSEDVNSNIVLFLVHGDGRNQSVDNKNKTITYKDCLVDSDLTLYAYPHKIEKWIKFKTEQAGEGGTGDRFTLGVLVPDGWTMEISRHASYILIKDAQKKVRFKSKNLDAIDSNNNHLSCKFVNMGIDSVNGNAYYKLMVQCDAVNAVYPILIDPTATLSGTSAIEDTFLNSSGVTTNWGNFSGVYYGNGGSYVPIWRIDKTQIPSGTISALRLNAYSSATAASALSSYFIADANTWVEGTASGSAQVGSCCWDYAIYSTQAWAGSAGCATSGTDYDADASPPTTTPSAGWNIIDLVASWATAWRDSTRANNGFIMHNATNTGYFYSTENASNQPYFEIDYSAPPSVVTNPLVLFRVGGL